jgi:RepB plasmid partitioning protein
MLLEALKNGLTEDRIAEALDLSLESIRSRRDLLNGICPEVVQILLNKDVNSKVFPILRKMKSVRQIEAAEHMVASATYTLSFAQALFAVTKPEMLNVPPSPRKLQVTSTASQSMLEEENETLLKNLKSVEQSYGVDVLTLTVSCGYINRLLKNQSIVRYLGKNHVEILEALQGLVSDVKPNAQT